MSKTLSPEVERDVLILINASTLISETAKKRGSWTYSESVAIRVLLAEARRRTDDPDALEKKVSELVKKEIPGVFDGEI